MAEDVADIYRAVIEDSGHSFCFHVAETASVRGDRRVIFGWAMYDWANSAYITTIAVAILPMYFAGGRTKAGS